MDRRKVLFVHQLSLSKVAGTTVVLADLVKLIPMVRPGYTVGYESFDWDQRPCDLVRRLSQCHADAGSVVAVNLHFERLWDYSVQVFEWCRRWDKPLYLYVHDYWPHHRALVEFVVAHYGARVLASTAYVRRCLESDGILTTLVQLGVSFSHVAVDTALPVQCHDLPKVVASTGRLVPRKRFEDVVQAFGRAGIGSVARLRLRLLPSLVFAPEEDERRLRELQLLANVSEIDRGVIEVVRKPGRRHGYGAFSVYVCASVYEGFSMPPIESAYSGCPPVMSDIPPHRTIAELLFGERSGDFLYPAGDNDALSDLLRHEIRTGDRMEYVRESIAGIRGAIEGDLSLMTTARALVAVVDSSGDRSRSVPQEGCGRQP